MKLKTSELTGAALDWAVAKCEKKEGEASCIARSRNVSTPVFGYSTDWTQGGPIIDREMQNGMYLHGGSPRGATYYCETLGGFTREYYGPTPLIAAMRCYVASKLGEEVEIPNALTKE